MATAGKVTVDTSGFKTFTAQFREQADEIVQKTAQDIAAQAQTNAPVVTGYLKNSIRPHKIKPLQARVEVGAEYGVYVEFGTGQRGAASNILRPPGITYSTNRVGRRAKPYLIPALEAARAPFVAAFKQLLARLGK